MELLLEKEVKANIKVQIVEFKKTINMTKKDEKILVHNLLLSKPTLLLGLIYLICGSR